MLADRINISNNFAEKLPKIIEAFVKFYGEEERERIEKAFKELSFVGYLRIEDYRALNAKCKEEATLKAGYDFLAKIGMEQTKDNVNRFFGNEVGTSFCPLKNFYEIYPPVEEWQHSIISDNISRIFGKEIVDGSPEYKEYSEQLLSYKPIYEEAVAYYEMLLKEYEPFMELCKSVDEFEEKEKRKYKINFLEEISKFMSESDREKIGKEELSSFDCCPALVDYEWTGKSLIDAFSEENERLLNDPDVPEWEKESIRDDRVAYYQKMGVNLGSFYEDYVDEAAAIKVTPSPSMVEKIISTRKRLTKEYEIDLYENLPLAQELKKKLDTIGFINKDTNFIPSIRAGGTNISVNIVKKGDSYVAHPILYISGGMFDDIMDCRLIHEMNHIFELILLNFDGKTAKYCSGWDTLEDEIGFSEEEAKQREYGHEIRSFELFSEIINELIAQDITAGMHEEGVYLYSDPDNASKTSGSGYQFAARLVWDFYQEFKKEIIESRKNHDMNILFKRVGKENFIALNNFVHEYLGSQNRIYNALRSIANGVENEDTLYYYQATKRSEEILSKMREYKMEDVYRV